MKRALLMLLLVTGLVAGARSFLPGGHVLGGTGASLGLGFLLIAGVQVGHVFHALRLPHLTGYLLCGLVFGPPGFGLLTDAMIHDLSLVKHVAVGLIALLAGCELNVRVLRPTLRAVGSYAFATTACTSLLLFGFFWLLSGSLSATESLSVGQRLAVSAVAANVLTAFSPAVVMGILTETRASGPLSRLVLSVVVFTDLLIALAFSLTNTIAMSVLPGGRSVGGIDILAGQILLSLLAGALLGAVLGIYITRVGRRIALTVFGLLFVVAETGIAIGIEPLLTGLAAGVFLENVSPVSGHQVIREMEPATLPVIVIFFGVIGAEIHLAEFLAVAPWALAAAGLRALGIFGGSALAAPRSALEPRLARLVPYGLLPQAGVALALANLVREAFDPWGTEVSTLLFGTIVVNELISPVLFRRSLVQSGEIPAAQTPTSVPAASPAS